MTRPILFLLFIAIPVIGFLQEPFYQEETGYSPLAEIKQVTGMGIDRNNCIWLATQAGVYRYDGNRFRHYSVLNTPALKFERFSEIFFTASKKGYNWGLFDFKGNYYGIDDQSRIVPFKPDIANNEVLIRCTYGYRDLLTGKGLKFHDDIKTDIGSILLTMTNRYAYILAGTSVRGMNLDAFLNSQKGELLYQFPHRSSNKVVATDRYLYIVTPKGIQRWEGNRQQGKPVVITGDLSVSNIQYDSLVLYAQVAPAVMMLGYKGCIYEVTELDNGSGFHTRLLIKGHSSQLPEKIFYSPSQQIILSYFSEAGLTIYRPSRFSLLTWNGPDNRSPRLDYYYSILPDGDGLITVNTDGIMRFGLDGQKKLLLGGVISRFSLFRDRSGNIWYEDHSTLQLSIFSPGSGKTRRILSTSESNGFCSAYQSGNRDFYVLTNRELYKLTQTENDEYNKELLLSIRDGSALFQVLYPLDEQTFLLGTDEGLMTFDTRSGKATVIPELKNTYVRSAIRLEKDNYLVGTYDKGIFQYMDNKWSQLPSSKGRLPSSAHGFVIDSITMSVWVSSNEGLSRIPMDLLYRNATGENTRIGFINHFGPGISPEFNGSSNISALKLSDTCIAFANAKGLVVFNPNKLSPSALPVNVLAELPEGMSQDSLNKIKPNELIFTPVIPYYGDAGDLTISYRLSGNDDEWRQLTPGSVISYNNIKPGKHELQFRIGSFHTADGNNAVLTAHRFTVHAEWYQQTWFKILAGLFILGLIILMHNIRIWYLRKRKEELEKMVAVKTRELEAFNLRLTEAIDELKLSEADLKQSNYLKDEYYAVLTHDLRSPLKFLSFNIGQLIDLLPDMESERLKKGLIVAYECTNDVHKLVDEFVYWIQNNENMLVPRANPTLPIGIITDIKKIYGFSLEENKNKLVTIIPPDLRFHTDPQMLFIILRNAIDNANKYTSGGTITVTAERKEDHLKLSVKDTGAGMKEEMVQQLTGLQDQPIHLSYEKRKSLGFYIMAMLTKKLNGRYVIRSSGGKGTEIDFIIPESEEI